MNIYIKIYGIKVKVYTENKSLYEMIKKYYKIFLVNDLENLDININLSRYGYFEKKDLFNLNDDFITFGDGVKINKKENKYYFNQQEISGLIKFENNGKIKVEGKLIPGILRYWLNIGLQGFTRIDKYYNRFIIKSCIHDIIFIKLEERLKSCLLHATVVTNGEKTFLFTGLGGSGKSTMAGAFSKIKGYKILSDNYAILSGNNVYPFPELPRVTLGTQKLLGIKLNKKADGIKNYLDNDLNNIKEKYKIDKIFICSYGKEFKFEKLENNKDIFELIYSINNYTKEFPEYLNLALLSVINKFNTNKQRIENLDNIINNNNFYLLENNENLKSNLNKIENV